MAKGRCWDSGISLEFKTDERNLWWDSDDPYWGPEFCPNGKPGFGVVVALRWGTLLGVIPFLKKNAPNPWFEKPWKVYHFPFIILPYISVAVGRYGFYLGGKSYGVNREEYLTWVPRKDMVQDRSRALCLSASIRKTRVK